MNMIKYILPLVALTAACSGQYEDGVYTDENGVGQWFEEDIADDLIGQAQQSLTAAVGYGTDDATSINCIPAVNTICNYPKDKVAYYRFQASTCNSWWQARVVSAWNDWLVVERDLGWDIKDPAQPGGFADYYLSCGDAGGGDLGYFSPSLSAMKGSLSAGTAHKTHNTGTIKIDTAQIEGVATWSTRSDVERQRFARNVIIHELFHSSGLGHSTNTASVMRGTGQISTSTWWSSLKYPTGTELGWIEDYVP